MTKIPRVTVLDKKKKTTKRLLEKKVTIRGVRKITRTITETEEIPLLVLSCGHEEYEGLYGKKSQIGSRVRCYACLAEQLLIEPVP